MIFIQPIAIPMPFDPNIAGGLALSISWHGFLSFVAVAMAVWFVARRATREGLDKDFVYNTALYAIVGGIIGARIVHVADHWDIYSNNPSRLIAVWEGGIGLWGGILGGWLSGITYAYFKKYPVGKLMDITATPLLLAQTIGRVGDIINGEHWSKGTDAPWGWFFTHPDSPARIGAQRYLGDPEAPVHPTVVYEMIWNILGLFLLYKLRNRFRPDGSIFMIYLAYYAVGRFAIQFLRLDRVHLLGLQEAHLIAILVLFVSVPFLVFKTRFIKNESSVGGSGSPSKSATGRQKGKRRLRRGRT